MKSRPSTPAPFSRILLAASLFAVCQAASAGLIAQRDGRLGSVLVSGPNIVSFTTTSAFSNVSIEAKLSAGNYDGDGAGTFYLMTSIGPGTTLADEVARIVLKNVPYATSGMDFSVMFSGLTLDADTYYLVESSNQGAGGLGWARGVLPTESVGVGVTIGTDKVGIGAPNAYAPASSLFEYPYDLLFRVSGDSANAVPEPAGMALVATALTALALTRRRPPRT